MSDSTEREKKIQHKINIIDARRLIIKYCYEIGENSFHVALHIDDVKRKQAYYFPGAGKHDWWEMERSLGEHHACRKRLSEKLELDLLNIFSGENECE